ncbi:MAG: HlyD family efflux transporter periplasmic adaptor subunit [Betaproteobacteria bacterium]|nr:HlyD family efflux transporter periplasmic adaptor subunit [Rubrivivax sp.]
MTSAVNEPLAATPDTATPAPARPGVVPVEPAPARSLATALKRVLDIQVALLEARSHREGLSRLAGLLAEALHGDEAAVALFDRGRLRSLARSAGASTEPELPEVRTLLAAMHEALDQGATVTTPETGLEPVPRIRLAQRRLIGDDAGSVACVLLPGHAGASDDPLQPRQAAGVICVRRRGPQSRPLGSADVAWLEHVAAFAAPVLGLLRQRERSLRWRALAGNRPAWLAGAGAAAGLLVLGGLGAWPVAHEVGGRARVEGAVQRVLVAPAAGFLKQAHVRPGDSVRTGQVLVELAEEDLRLEQERLSAQSVQFESALAEANAKADRAQVMIQLARLQQARAQLALVESQLGRTRLQAPFDAVVVQGDLGQRLGAPLQQGEELLVLAPEGRYRVIVEVGEDDVARVRPGQPGELMLAALPWKTLALEVRHVSPMAKAVEGRNVFEVEAEVLDPPAELRPGLSGNGRVVVGERGLATGWLADLAAASRRLWWRLWG